MLDEAVKRSADYSSIHAAVNISSDMITAIQFSALGVD
jgi:hypothetical protein